MNDRFLIVIRAAGERTAAACEALVRDQVQGAPVEVVSEVPFEQALRRTFQLGIEHGRPWTLTLDADVLLRPGAVAELLAAAEAMPAHYVQLEGRILDKVMGSYRQAGHRIYRSALLGKALEQVPPDGREIRPEYHTLQRMGALGHPSRRVALVAGVHDHFQGYKDLYRKAFVHARKHRYMAGHIVARCAPRMDSDPDMKVVLKGFMEGLLHDGRVSIDKRLYADLSRAALEALGLHEKTPLGTDALVVEELQREVIKLLAEQPAPPFATMDEPDVDGTEHRPEGPWAALRYRVGRYGAVAGSVRTMGAVLKRLGYVLDPKDK